MCVGRYVDNDGLSHPIDNEVKNVYRIPWRPMNVLAMAEPVMPNIFLFTGPRGNELFMPGVANQKLGRCHGCTQAVDHACSPALVFNLGKGRPIIKSPPLNDGRVWTHVTDVLRSNEAACVIAAVQQPEGKDYVSTAFLAQLDHGHCGDPAMRSITQALELYGDMPSSACVAGVRHEYEGCHLACNIKRNQGLHQGKPVGKATLPGESLHVDVACPIVPMGIGHGKYVLVAVDELTRFAWVFPMRKKAQTARLLARLIQRIHTQNRQPGEPGVRRLHSDQGGEFKMNSLEDICRWKGFAHTFTDRAQHQSNGLVARKIGQLNESTRAALPASDLPAYMWPEVYLAML